MIAHDWSNMSVIVTGSIATDYLMKYPGMFREHILIEQTGKLSVSFLVEEKEMSRGGIGPNISYTMALLGERPRLMGTVGQDFGDYRAWLEQQGIDTSLVVAYPGEFTATFTVITDLEQNQIAGFHSGAMARGRELTYRGLDMKSIDYVIISPHDPEGMIRNCTECRELGLRFIFDPSQQLARLDRGSGAPGHAGRLRHDGQRLRARADQVEDRAERERYPGPRRHAGRHPRHGRLHDHVQGSPHWRAHRAGRHRRRPRLGVGDAFRGGLLVGLMRGYPWDITARIRAGRHLLPGAGRHDEPPLHRPQFVARYREHFGDAPELGAIC